MKKDNLNYLISILSSSPNWFSAAEIASIMHTTTRTVRNYVAEINSLYPSQPILTSHAGYSWNGNTPDALHFFPKLQRSAPESPEERLWYLLRGVAYRDGITERPSVAFSSLCGILAVSEKTLEADIDAARKFLHSYDLRLHIRKDYLTLSGAEANRRRLIYDIVRHYNSPLLTLSAIDVSFPLDPVKQVMEVLREILPKYNLAADAYHEVPLLLLLLIQAHRIRGGKAASPCDIALRNLENLPEHTAAEALITQISSLLQVHYSKCESDYLTMLLFCFCHSNSKLQKQYQEDVKMVSESLSHLNHQEHIDFLQDGFPEQLTDFLIRLRLRCSIGLSADNPLVSSIRNASPLVHDEAAWIMTTFRKEWCIDPNRNELGWLSLLLSGIIRRRSTRFPAISCILVAPDFADMTEFLIERLELHFGGQLRIDHVLRSCDSSVVPHSDMVLSVMELKNTPRYILISPALTMQDYAAIRQGINRLEQKRQYEAFGMYLQCYSSSEFFKRNHNFSSAAEAIDVLCSELESQHRVDAPFREQLLAREAADFTSYHNLIAVPHAAVTGVRHNTISIVMNDRPVQWGDQKANLIVLVAMEHGLMADFREFYYVLIRLFESRKNMEKLLEASDYQSFLNIIEKLSIQ